MWNSTYTINETRLLICKVPRFVVIHGVILHSKNGFIKIFCLNYIVLFCVSSWPYFTIKPVTLSVVRWVPSVPVDTGGETPAGTQQLLPFVTLSKEARRLVRDSPHPCHRVRSGSGYSRPRPRDPDLEDPNVGRRWGKVLAHREPDSEMDSESKVDNLPPLPLLVRSFLTIILSFTLLYSRHGHVPSTCYL